jgi:SAM-dependent methyltransferase
MSTVTWGKDVAETYDATSAAMFDPSVVDPVVDVLSALADGGAALEFAIGTGRIALPLSRRGVTVCGIELSPHMAEQLRRKPGAEAIHVVAGDMTAARVPGPFSLVYLVYNTIMNVTTQEEQVAVFRNAAAHLKAGGCFVVEVGVPELRRLPPGELGRVFALSEDHVGIETFDDVASQVTWSIHWTLVDGRLVRHSAPYRYVWPSELDLMAQLAGFRTRHRWSGWGKEPFGKASRNLVAVFEKLPA